MEDAKQHQDYGRYACWGLSKTCLAAGFFWGLAEGTFFFIIPDVVITFVALFSLRRSLQVMGMVLIGSLLAGLLMFYFGRVNFDLAKSLVLHVPFVYERMFVSTHEGLEQRGLTAFLKGPMSGIPYKVYAVQAPEFSSVLAFLLVSIPARLERFILTWALFATGGYLLKKSIMKRQALAAMIHAIYWIVIYAVYWIKI